MKRWMTALAAFVMTLTGWAQTIRVEVHNIVELGERFNVVFVVDGEHAPSDFQWSPGDDFTLVWGPQKGTSTSISIVNGKTTKTSQTSYTYILQAKKTGAFQLASATATVKGTEIHSRAAQVTVVEGRDEAAAAQGSSGGTSGNASGSAGEARQSASQNTGEIFMRLNLSKREAVVGEPITATLKIYQRANLTGFEDAKFPKFNGFWSQEVDTPQNIEFQREQVGDKMFNAAVLRRWVLIPQKSGTLTIDPSEVVCLVNVRTQRQRTGSIFDDFFENDYVTQRQRVMTPAIGVKVTALPGGAPAGFSGAVGEYSVSARISKDSLRTHDAASLIVTVTGKGNVSLVEAPKISFPPDFEAYDVKATSATDKSGTNGSKTFEYPFIPRSPGSFTLPPVRFSYYDVKGHRYATASTDSLRLSVARSAGGATQPVQDGAGTLTVDRKGVKNLGEDIRFIKTKTSLSEDKGFFVGKPLFWGLVAFLVLAAAAVWLSLRKLAARRADVVGTRNRKATRQALKRLKLAGDFLNKNLYTAFYEELHRALIGFIADKLTMDMADQSKENIAEALSARGVPEATVKSFTDLLDACEYARYAPDAGHEAMNAHYEQAVSVITAIDSSMKKGISAAAAAPVIALLLALPLGAQAAESYPDSLWTAGVEAYSAGQWAEALQDWSDVAATGLRSKELYYNLGNAYFKTGETAQAVLNYERALRLDPSDADVRYNLEFARAMTQDRIDEVPEFILKTWIRKIGYWMSSDAWAVLSLVFLALTLALVLLFLLGPTAGMRRTGFFAGIATLLLSLAAFGFARSQKADAERHDEAIVMRPVSSVTSSPSSDAAKSLFILHEGTKVKVLDEVSGYKDIELADGRRGWIASGDIEII
ncbi:MAG: BatD family protein [Bacteroidales bacterium]|nr:BatD family protein [Bacteroidales bacterium]